MHPIALSGTALGPLSPRARRLFEQHRDAIYRRTDRLFAALLAGQWLAAVAAALWLSPRAWTGASSQVHLHVWAAALLGGALTLPAALLALRAPGRALTRHAVGVCQMLMGALLIHLCGGRLETHFHVFGSLAFLAFYRDWRVLLSASAVVGADHLLRGLFWPESVFGTPLVENWRWLEHAGWVLFEDFFLVLACRQGTLEMQAIAARQAQLEETHAGIEQTVRQRTAELVEQAEQLTRVGEELRASQARTEAVIEAAADAILTVDEDGLVRSANEAAGRMFGYRREELVGLPAAALLGGPIGAWAGPGGREAEGRRRDGTALPLEISVSEVPASGERLWLGILRDVSPRKQAEAALQRAKEAAEAASRAKSEFLANMSHEIRTPMNGVLGMTELALGTDLSAEQREYLGMVKTSADALLNVINDILDFSKIEAGKLEFEALDFSLGEGVGDALKALAVRAHKKGLELAYHIRSDVPFAVVGDPGRLRQVLVNLVGNAIKFTERGEVIVTIERCPAALLPSHAGDEPGDVWLHFAVADTGIGIPAASLATIFDAFTQADGSTTRKYGGTGLGLTISARLVKLMGGRIWVESQVGKGSTFHFTARLGLQRASSVWRAQATPESLVGLPVLVVDDNATNRRILQEMLSNWRMRPTVVEGGPEALAALESAAAVGDPYLLVLTDQMMPDMDGFALAERIKGREELSDAVILMLSSADRAGDSARCRQLGLARYVVKPIKQSELLDAILQELALPLDPVAPSKGPAAQTTSPQARLGEAPAAAPRRALRVLVAEDNDINQKLARRLLSMQGHTVLVAGNGREALEVLGREAIDLVLMDVQMPEMGGLEATAHIRAREKGTGRRLPVVALTAHAMKGDRESCLAAGMDAYVSKPIQEKELLRALDEVAALLAPVSAADGEPADAAGAVDVSAALEGTGGDREFLGELAGDFLREYPAALTELRAAVEEADAVRLHARAHKLLGSLRVFHAAEAERLARELEALGKDRDLSGAAAALDRLAHELARVGQSLEELAAAGSRHP